MAKTLSKSQQDVLRRSNRLSQLFRDKIIKIERSLRNDARKLIKANNADSVFHQESFDAQQAAKAYTNFRISKWHGLNDNQSGDKAILVDILTDFDWPDAIEGVTKEKDLVEIMEVATYDHPDPAIGTINIFDLVLNQVYEEHTTNAKPSA